jgi:hypothetical protein
MQSRAYARDCFILTRSREFSNLPLHDTLGEHHDLLKKTGWEIVTARGPIN